VIEQIDPALNIFFLIEYTYTGEALAVMGPCTTAAATTPYVIVFVTDIDRSMRWYRENVGLEASNLHLLKSTASRAVTMSRSGAGLTLVGAPSTRPSQDPQMVCFVFEGRRLPYSAQHQFFFSTQMELRLSYQRLRRHTFLVHKPTRWNLSSQIRAIES
jgi:Glyoxalase/Bleomycin resistance protein/Dioxygenase superfamily